MKKYYFLLLAIFLLFAGNTKAATYYWVGGSGNWNVITNWATTSGGTTHYTGIPSSTDDVIFDDNSGSNYQLTISAGSCHNMRWIGTSGIPKLVLSGKLDISGSLELQSGMQIYSSANNSSISLTFSATSPGNTIKTNGVVIGNGIGTAYGIGVTFKGIGGGWTLSDDYITSNSSSITLTAGSLNFNGKNVSIESFNDGGTTNTLAHTLNMAGSNITILATFVSSGATITGSGWGYNSPNGAALTTTETGGSTITLNNFTTTGINTKPGDVYNDVILLKGANTVTSGVSSVQIYFNNFTTYDDTNFGASNITFNHLSLLGTGSYTFSQGYPITIKNALDAHPSTCGGTIGLNAENGTKTAANQSIFTFAAGATANVQNALIRNIISNGLTPNAVNSVDLGNNSNWNFTQVNLTYYWVGGPGNWNDASHWSLTSGGPSSGCLPTASDDVMFDASSGSATVTINATASCRNMTWNGAPGAVLNVNDKFFISGSLTLQPGMAMNVAPIINIINFVGNSANTITTNGVTINVTSPPASNNDIITFSRSGGSWTLMDNFNAPNASLDLNVGDLNFGGKNATIFSFKVTTPLGGVAKLEINNSTIECKISAALGYLNYTGWSDHVKPSYPGPTITALNTSGSTIILDDSNFDTYSSVYNNIIFKGSTAAALFNSYSTNTGNTTITSLQFLSNGSIADKMQAKIGTLTLSPGSSYIFPVLTTSPASSGIVTVTTALNANGGLCSGIINIASSIPGTQTTIAAAGSTVNMNNAILQDIKITGSTPYTATNSTDNGNNTGWNFIAPPVHNYYWVGGTGNWNDVGHWSSTSGGVYPSTTGCIPTASDNVFFDGGSGFTTGSTVTVDGYAYCNNMNWAGAAIPATFDIESPMNIFGSLELQSGMSVIGNIGAGTGNISYFNFTGSNPNNTIKSNSVVINIPTSTQPNGVMFNGTSTGSWKLLDPLQVTAWVTLAGGNLNFNGQNVTMGVFTSGNGPATTPRSLNIAGSAITLKSGSTAMAIAWNYNVSGAAPLTTTETAGSSITFAQATQTINAKSTDVYDTLLARSSGMTVNGGIYNKVDFINAPTNSTAAFYNSPIIDILNMKSGGVYTIQTGTTLTVNKVLAPNGTPCSITQIKSSTNGVQANISMLSSAANFTPNIYGIDFVQMQDINAITPATDPTRAQMRVGNNSTAENRNNTGWIIVPHTATPVVDGLGTDRVLGCKDYPYVLTTTAFYPNPTTTFKWNDNSTGDTLTVTGPGTYNVTVTYATGCTLSGSVTLGLAANPVLSVTSATATCTGSTVVLTGLKTELTKADSPEKDMANLNW